MAWSKAESELDAVLGLDIDGWDEVSPAVKSSIRAWILEDRTHPAGKKAEQLLKKRKKND